MKKSSLDRFIELVQEEKTKSNPRKPISSSIRLAIFERDNYRCKICGRDVSDGIKLEVDHIIPVSKGGEDWPGNLCVLCFDCNRGKFDAMPSERLLELLQPNDYIYGWNDDGNIGVSFYVEEEDSLKIEHYSNVLGIEILELYEYVIKFYAKTLLGKKPEVIDMANSPNKRFASCEIDPDEHSILHTLATYFGIQVSEVVAMAVRKFLKEVNPENPAEMTPDLIVYRNSIKAKRNDYIRGWLKDLAYTYQAFPTEENADLLRESAEVANIPIEEILEGIEQDRLTPASIATGNRALDKAVEFLDHAMEHGAEYPATQIQDQAKAAGIVRYNLDLARRKLDIRSERRSTCWVWVRE